MPTIITTGAAAARSLGAFSGQVASYNYAVNFDASPLSANREFLSSTLSVQTNKSLIAFAKNRPNSSSQFGINRFTVERQGNPQNIYTNSITGVENINPLIIKGSYNYLLYTYTDPATKNVLYRLDNSGNVITQKYITAGYLYDYINNGNYLTADSSGNVYHVYSTGTNYNIIKIEQFDSSLNVVSGKNYTNTLNIPSYGKVVTAKQYDSVIGLVYAVSGYNSTVLPAPYAAAVHSPGNYYFVVTMTSGQSAFIEAINTDNAGNTYVLIVNQTSGYVELLKLNSSGVRQWSRRIAALALVNTKCYVEFDPSGYIYIVFLASGYGVVIAKYDSSGTKQWIRSINPQYGSMGYVRDFIISANDPTNMYICGSMLASEDGILAALDTSYIFKLPTDGTKTQTFYAEGYYPTDYTAITPTETAGSYTGSTSTAPALTTFTPATPSISGDSYSATTLPFYGTVLL